MEEDREGEGEKEGAGVREGGEDEEDGGFERKWGTTIRDWRGSVGGEFPLGRWLSSVWNMALVRQDYEAGMGEKE